MLHSERLVIRRFEPRDADAFAEYRGNPDVARFQSWSVPLAPGYAQRMVADFAAGDPDAPGWFQYAIATPIEGALIGDIGVHLDDNMRQADIGFTLAPAWQGRGYAFEAVNRMLEHLFSERGLHKVSADCDARNEPSAKLLDRLGFKREGLRRQHTWIKGEWTDDLLFGLLSDEFPGNR